MWYLDKTAFCSEKENPRKAVQHGIARQAEDIVDAVVLAPCHGLPPAVVAVSPEGARPVPADAAHQVLEEGADLDARRRLAGAQENRHRLAALHMVDVDRQEAAGVVVPANAIPTPDRSSSTIRARGTLTLSVPNVPVSCRSC